MIHSASVSCRQTEIRRSLESPILDSRASDSRLRINSSQLRGHISHAYIQTDLRFESFSGVDEGTQVDSMSELVGSMESEISDLRRELQSNATRCADRERILISQMNAIRDQQLYAKSVTDDELVISVALVEIDLQVSANDHVLDTMYLIINLSDAETGAVHCSVQTETFALQMQTKQPSQRLVSTVRINRNVGQSNVGVMGYAFSTVDDSIFKVVIGEWTSPPFVPCLKETRNPERLNVLFPRMGAIVVELVYL